MDDQQPDNTRNDTEKEQKSDQSSPQPAEQKQGGQFLRIVVWGATVVFAILATIEIIAQRSAQQTGEAWRQVYRDVDTWTGEMTRSQLKEHIVGSPEREQVLLADLEIDDPRYPDGVTAKISRHVITYTWRGILRDFKVHVYLGLRNDPAIDDDKEDPPVEDIVGPFDPSEADRAEFIDIETIEDDDEDDLDEFDEQ